MGKNRYARLVLDEIRHDLTDLRERPIVPTSLGVSSTFVYIQHPGSLASKASLTKWQKRTMSSLHTTHNEATFHEKLVVPVL